MSTAWKGVLLATILGVSGCVTATPSTQPAATAASSSADTSSAESNSGPATAPVFAPVTPGTVSPEPAQQISKLQTSLSPQDAREVAINVFKDFSFFPNGIPNQTGDFFSQEVGGTTAHNEVLSVQIAWVKEGLSTLTFQSPLPAAQHEFVFQRLGFAVHQAETGAARRAATPRE